MTGQKARAARATQDRHPIEQADTQAAAAVASWRDHPAMRAMAAISEVADQPPMIALSSAVAVAGLARRDVRMVRAGVRMLAAHALATAAKTVIKNNVDRSRPKRLIEGADYRLEQGDSEEGALRSFPSGHSAGGMAVVRALGREYPDAGIVAGGALAVVMASLVPKQAHYPSDIVAGAAIGWAAEMLVDAGWRRLAPHLPDAAVQD